MTNPKIILLAAMATVVATFGVLYLLGNLLLVFGFSGVIAYMLLPVVKLIERVMPWREKRSTLARTIAVSLVFIGVLAIVGGGLFLIVPPSVRQTTEFMEEFPQLFRNARATVEGWVAIYSDRVPEQIKQQIEEAAANAGTIVLNAAQNLLTQTISIVSTSFSLIIGFAIAPILIYYLVKDSASIQSGLLNPFPAAMKPHIRNIIDIAHRTVGAYIRGQLTLGLVVGSVVAVALLLLGVPFAFLLGIAAGITELIPFIGPWIGGAVGVLVTLATAPDKVLWVLLVYIGIQLLENTVLVPRIQGHTLNLHPAVVLLVITIGSQIWGFWGVILGPPVVALVKDLTVYFAEQWQLTGQTPGLEVKPGAPQPAVPAETGGPGGPGNPEAEAGEDAETRGPGGKGTAGEEGKEN